MSKGTSDGLRTDAGLRHLCSEKLKESLSQRYGFLDFRISGRKEADENLGEARYLLVYDNFDI